MLQRLALACLLALLVGGGLPAAEIAVLTNDNWEKLTPRGKEVDCILGDYALRSDRLVAVVAQPAAWRNANMTVKQVAGCVIDLTPTDRPNDQLSAFYPGRRVYPFSKAEVVTARGKKVKLVCLAEAEPSRPEVRLEYELEDGQPYLVVRSVFTNTGKEPIRVELEDDLRADGFDRKVKAGATDLFWVHDHYFEQAYGLLADGHAIRSRSDPRLSVLQYTPEKGEGTAITLQPGQSHTLTRRLLAGASLLGVKGEAARVLEDPVVEVGWHFVDPIFQPVAGVDVTLRLGDAVLGTARSDAWGWVKAAIPPGRYTLAYAADGRGTFEQEVSLAGHRHGDIVNTEYPLPEASRVVARVSDERGGPIPCKVAFKGVGATTSPSWGPPAAREAVVNLFYSATGRFTVPINPGSYEVIISRGPEYDVVRLPLEVKEGQPAPLEAVLKRAFSAPGWVSTDFHSHSSPSGDNTGDQRGRVLNLLAEHIEFAPCTEHNRLDSYTPHLKALGAEKLLGTCVGMELTGTPLPLNHQNAFPLLHKPRTQDGGAPLTDVEPEVQIRRLFEWDGKTEKLVQQNHPDIGWLFFDRNGDGKPDEGHRAGFPYMHVIEVHPISEVLAMQPGRIRLSPQGKRLLYNNSIFNWLQLLNQGYRIWGVVNTDAHYNYHGSGGLRNYVRCGTETPGDIDPMEIVRECRQGHIIMSTAPYLHVKLNDALPGDSLKPAGGKATLAIDVHCASWYDVDRVQVLLNGRPEPSLSFTRQSHPALFTREALRFRHKVDLELKEDAHVIVVAAGETELGEVMGPMWGRQAPVAISNPIFVDIDGGGFKPNGDTLGAPLPTRGGNPVTQAGGK